MGDIGAASIWANRLSAVTFSYVLLLKLAGSSKQYRSKGSPITEKGVTSLMKKAETKVAGNTYKGRRFQSSPVETKKF